MNKVMLIGNLTKDPELSTTSGGVNFCRFSLAVQRRFSGADGQKVTDFFNVVAWRGLADNCSKYLKKGNKAAVTGEIQNRTVDKPDGTKSYYTDIVADDVEFLTPKNSGGEEFLPDYDDEPKAQKPAAKKGELTKATDDDLPF